MGGDNFAFYLQDFLPFAFSSLSLSLGPSLFLSITIPIESCCKIGLFLDGARGGTLVKSQGGHLDLNRVWLGSEFLLQVRIKQGVHGAL